MEGTGEVNHLFQNLVHRLRGKNLWRGSPDNRYGESERRPYRPWSKKGFMHIATQLALFLENKPGPLARVCDELERSKINIYAVATSDTIDHSVVRMVVSDTRKALLLFEEIGR